MSDHPAKIDARLKVRSGRHRAGKLFLDTYALVFMSGNRRIDIFPSNISHLDWSQKYSDWSDMALAASILGGMLVGGGVAIGPGSQTGIALLGLSMGAFLCAAALLFVTKSTHHSVAISTPAGRLSFEIPTEDEVNSLYRHVQERRLDAIIEMSSLYETEPELGDIVELEDDELEALEAIFQ